MRTPHRAALVTLLFLTTAPLHPVSAPTVKEDQCALKVDYRDGTEATFLLKWLTNRQARKWETGSPAIPLKGQFTDTRRCQWEILGEIERRVYLIGPEQGLYVREGQRPIILRLTPRTGRSSWNCNDASPAYETALRAYTTTLETAARGAIARDWKAFQEELRAKPAVRRVRPSPMVQCAVQ